MRFLAILPVLLCIASLVLTFLCLFAGHTTGFMEDYALITLNSSRFGETLVNISTTGQGDSSNILQQLWNEITTTVQNDLNDDINALAKKLGLRDFYSLHVLDYCEGYYEPAALPNATLSRSQIWQNTTNCSTPGGLFTWNPRNQIQAELNASGFSYIDVSQYWPKALDDSIRDLQSEFKATFALYCVAIALTFLAVIAAIASIFFLGRLFSIVNVVLDAVAFVVLAIASALVTAVMVQGVKNINGYGQPVAVESYYSSKFLAITWVATVLLFVASCLWCLDCIIGRRDKGSRRTRGPLHSTRKDPEITTTNAKAYHYT